MNGARGNFGINGSGGNDGFGGNGTGPNCTRCKRKMASATANTRARPMFPGMFEPVFFGFDSSSVPAAERKNRLQRVADYLNANPSHGVLVEGYCDWYGTSEYELRALGDRRADNGREMVELPRHLRHFPDSHRQTLER